MANYANLMADIRAAIKQNGNQEITGNILQQSLVAMISSLGNGYLYKGIATPSTNPGSPDQNIFYIATTAGTYANMGGLTLDEGDVAIIRYNGSWIKDLSGIATKEGLSQLNEKLIELTSVKKTQALILGGDTPFLSDSYITSIGNIDGAGSYKVFYFPCVKGDKFTINIDGLSEQVVARLFAVYSDEEFSSDTALVVSNETLSSDGSYAVEITSDDAKYIAIGYKSNVPSITATRTRLVGVVEEVENKVDKIEGKGLSTNDYTDYEKEVVNTNALETGQEYLKTIIDENGNIIEDITADGDKEIHIPVKFQGASVFRDEDDSFVKTETDKEGNIIRAVDKNGKNHLAVPTNQDDILDKRIANIETRFIDIMGDNWNYHEECIFHDNFCREIKDVNRPWDIGSNSSEESGVADKYAYRSLYGDNIDDGFRIISVPGLPFTSPQRLVNYKYTYGRKGFRIVKNLTHNNNIVVVINNPTENNLYQAIAINVMDIYNYELIRFHRYSDRGIVGTLFFEHITCVDGVETITPLVISAAAYGNTIRVYFVNGQYRIYLDDNRICEGRINATIANVGLFVEPSHDYSYHFINIYYVNDKLAVLDTSQSVDKDIFNNGYTTHHGQIETIDKDDLYCYHLVDDVVKFGRCERFEIRHPEGVVIDAKSDRQENGFNPQHIPMLGKYRCVFDVMFPADFVGDDYVETIFQQHASMSVALSPCVAFHVKKSEIDATKWAISLITQTVIDQTNAGGYVYQEEHEFCFVEPGKWHHFEICIKSGYIPEQNPISVVKVDNIEVLKLLCPNAHNVSKPDFLRYGIYKPIWLYQDTNTDKRVCYFNNFKVVY